MKLVEAIAKEVNMMIAKSILNNRQRKVAEIIAIIPDTYLIKKQQQKVRLFEQEDRLKEKQYQKTYMKKKKILARRYSKKLEKTEAIGKKKNIKET